MKKILPFFPFLILIAFSPLVASAQATGVTLSLSPTSVELGQEIQVAYSIAPSVTFSTSDSIAMVKADTGQLITSQRVGSSRTGTKIFSYKKPGTYFFRYVANISGKPVLATTGNVTISIPDASRYTLVASPTTLSLGESLTVTYAAPPHAHQSGDDIVIVNAATNKFVSSQSLGSSPTGTKTFTIDDPGSYLIQYKLTLVGYPVVKTVGPVTVLPPASSNYSLSLSAATIDSGQEIVVTYAGPAASHQTGDDIVIIETETGRQVAIQSLGSQSSGSKSFLIRNPGSYTAEYKLALSGTPIVRTAGPFIVKVPDASLFALSVNPGVAEVNQPVALSFSSPEYAHQYGDDILVFDAVTGALLKTVTVGSSPSGTKTFRFLGTGTFKFAYRMNVSGNPIVAESAIICISFRICLSNVIIISKVGPLSTS